MVRSNLMRLGLVSGLLVACLSLTLVKAAENDARPPASLTLTGHGEVRAAPDIAIVSIGVTTQAQNAREAAGANNRAMTEAVNSLKAAGIEPRDLQTGTYSLQPLYASDPSRTNAPRIASYRATNTLTVTVRDLARVGDILERAVSLGANTVSGPVFSLSEPEAKRNEARKLAIAEVTARARLYAEGLGFRLGRVLKVSEGESYVRARSYAPQAAAPVAAAPPPIEAGESAVSANVTVEWEILPQP